MPETKTKKKSNQPEQRYDLQVLRMMRQINRMVDIYSRQLKVRYNLTSPQLICLMGVVEDGLTNTTTLAKKVFLSPSTVVGIVDRLQLRNLIKRVRDTRDRRIVNIKPTRSGIALAESAPSPLQESLANTMRKLPQQEQETIARSLERIAGMMQPDNVTAKNTKKLSGGKSSLS